MHIICFSPEARPKAAYRWELNSKVCGEAIFQWAQVCLESTKRNILEGFHQRYLAFTARISWKRRPVQVVDTTTIQQQCKKIDEDRSAMWNLQRRTTGRDLETKKNPIEETTAILPIGAATYSSLSSSDSLIFFSQVSSSPCSKVFPSSTILPWKTGHSCDSGIPFQVYAQTAHAIFNMADVEDDEKFLYGGKVFLACYGLFLLYVGLLYAFDFTCKAAWCYSWSKWMTSLRY